MQRIIRAGPNSVKIETVVDWPKCDFCGFFHPVGKCKKLEWVDNTYKTRKI